LLPTRGAFRRAIAASYDATGRASGNRMFRRPAISQLLA
jgi:hypothetical protein